MMKRFIIGAMLILGLCSWVKAQKIDVRIRVVDECISQKRGSP